MSFFRRTKTEGPPSADNHPLQRTQTPSKTSFASSQTPSDLSQSKKDVTTLSTDSKTAANIEDREIHREEEESSKPPLVRPKTPSRGSNHTAWSSYRDLPETHPVFRYPDEVREKMYSKGIDPVVKAEMDLARLGKVYGESHHAKGFWKRGTSMMGQFGTMATGGSF